MNKLSEIQKVWRLALLLLVWALPGYGQSGSFEEDETPPLSDAGRPATESDRAGSAEAPQPSIYETLIFDAPVALTTDMDPDWSGMHGQARRETAPSGGFERQLQSLESVQQSISAIEFEGGAWDLGLAENLVAMAELYSGQGAYQEAVDAYERAIHVSRVNLGLDSLEHIPTVERLIDNYVALGDWQSADRYQEYLYYTHRKAFGLDDPRMLPVLDRLARWKLSVFNARWGDQQGLNLISALRLYRIASTIVSTHFGSGDERYFRYLRDTAGTAYLVARYQGLVAEASQPEYRIIEERYPDQSRTFSPAFIEGYEEGLDALQLIVDSFGEEDRLTTEYAAALNHLGDWYLLFDRRRTAETLYAEAYGVLAAQENGDELIREVFGKVMPLPTFSDEIETIFISSAVSSREQEARKIGFVDVEFAVSAYGAVTDLAILTDESLVDSRVLSSLRRKVRATTFRPIVENGEMVRSEGNRFRYRFVY